MTASTPDLAGLVISAPPEVWGRTVLAVAAMHEPDVRGRCRYCRPGRRRRWHWRRYGTCDPCPTRRLLLVEIGATRSGPEWTAA